MSSNQDCLELHVYAPHRSALHSVYFRRENDLNFVEQGLPHGKSYQWNFQYEGHKWFSWPCRTPIWVPLNNFSEVGTRVVCYPSVTSESPWNQYIVKYLQAVKPNQDIHHCHHVTMSLPCHRLSKVIATAIPQLSPRGFKASSCFRVSDPRSGYSSRSVGIFSWDFAFTMRDRSHISLDSRLLCSPPCMSPLTVPFQLWKLPPFILPTALCNDRTQYHDYFRLGYCFNTHRLSSRICIMFTLTREHCGSMLFFPYSLHTLAVHFLSLPSQSCFTGVHELYAFRAILTVLLWKPGGFSGTNWFQGGHYGWLKVPRVAISKYLNLRKVVKSDAFVSGINHGLKMLAMRFHPTLTGSWYDAARFVATCPQNWKKTSWSLGGEISTGSVLPKWGPKWGSLC